MTPAELKAIGPTLYPRGWQTKLAEALGVNPRTVRKWARGDHPIPGPASAAIQLMMEKHG